MKHCPKWLFVLAGGVCVAAGAAPVPEQLADAVKIPDFDLAAINDRRVVELPPLPRRKGLVPVIRMKMYAEAPKAAGCFRCVDLAFNDTPLERFAETEERLLGRKASFQLPNHPGREFPVFASSRIMLTYGPDWQRANAVSTDRHAAEFCFRLDDMAQNASGNTLTLVNTRSVPGAVCVRDMEVGYVSEEVAPPPPRRADAVKAILVDKYGIAAGRINAIGHGVGDIFSEPAWNRVGICTIDETN